MGEKNRHSVDIHVPAKCLLRVNIYVLNYNTSDHKSDLSLKRDILVHNMVDNFVYLPEQMLLTVSAVVDKIIVLT